MSKMTDELEGGRLYDVVQNGKEEGLGVHCNVLYEFVVMLSR